MGTAWSLLAVLPGCRPSTETRRRGCGQRCRNRKTRKASGLEQEPFLLHDGLAGGGLSRRSGLAVKSPLGAEVLHPQRLRHVSPCVVRAESRLHHSESVVVAIGLRT